MEDDVMTNQSADSTEEDLVIDEATGVAEDTGTAEEETPAESTEEKPEAEEQAAKEFLKIKYNGAEESLTQEQAIELAQKGRNYDKVYGQLQDLRNDPTIRVIDEQARRAGLTRNEYITRLAQFQDESNISRIAQEFKTKYPDVSDEVADQYARSQYQNQLNARAQQEAKQRQQSETHKRQIASEQVRAFMTQYPDVKIDKLPDEVVADINNGESLLSAYRAYENKQMRAEIAALRKNGENKKKAVGHVAENAGGTGEKDPFLKGLLGGD